MKKILTTALFVTTVMTFAQAQISAGLTLAPVVPTGGYAKFAGIGFGLTGEGRYVLNDQMTVGINVGHYRTPTKDLQVPLQFRDGVFAVGYRGNYRSTFVTSVTEYFLLEDELRPFVGLEAGAFITGYTWKEDEAEVTQAPEFKESKVGFGLAPIVGALYELNDGLELSATIKYTLTGASVQIFENPGVDEKSIHLLTINFGIRITPSEF